VAVVRVLVVDDHPVFAGAIAAVIDAQPDFSVVGTSASSSAALFDAGYRRAEIAVVDANLGRESGVGLVRLLRQERPALLVVLLVEVAEVSVAVAAVRAGACAIVEKGAPVEDLFRALRGALRGETSMPPLLLTGVLASLQREDEAGALSGLTIREREVLHCLIEGLDRAAIADRLCVSVHTVKTHTRNIYQRLGVHSHIEAVSAARALMNEGRVPRLV
jgi:DNA-binding NarL/FixJ family response regulator